MGPTCDCPVGRNPFCRGGFGRREALRATGIGFIATLTGILTDSGRIANAQPVTAPVPVVDRLSVRIVTDVYTDPYAASPKPNGIRIERVGRVEKPGAPPHATLRAEWGLSMMAESARGDETRRVLVDFGYSSEVLLTNMGLLGIDLAAVDALVLSHGHFDHFGGLMGLLAAAKGKLKPNLPLFVGGEDCFCARQIGEGLNYGVLDRHGILEAGIRLMIAEGPAIVADHAVTSGQIPKTTYEDPLRSTSELIGMTGGIGCDPALEPATKNTGTYVPDDFQHEIATSYLVKDRGLVVLTSCSHRGVLNTIRQAQAAAGTDKLHAVVGGFHLIPPLTDDYVRRSVAELNAMKPDFVIPAHCAGERFYDVARTEMPNQILRSAVGTRVTFGV